MTWQCLEDTPESKEAGTQRVRFFFEEAPNDFVTVAAPNLCELVQSTKSSKVQVRFLIWGIPSRGVTGFVPTSVNGRRFQIGLGTGGAGHVGDDNGPDPLLKALRDGRE